MTENERCSGCQRRGLVAGVCLDCGQGRDEAGRAAVAEAIDALTAWLPRAEAVLNELPEDDERYAGAVATVVRRRATLLALDHTFARELGRRDAAEFQARFPFAVRWGRERGWLEIRDVFDGGWLRAEASSCPDWWRWAASQIARAERARRAA